MGELAKKSYDIRFFEEVDYSLHKKDVIVVIPAYEPDEKLISVYKDIMSKTDYKIIIVNDGSSNDYRYIFDTIMKENQREQGLVYKNNYDLVRYMSDRLVILEHSVNIGKGVALKSAFEFINDNFMYDVNVVTVAADGEHRIKDVKKVCNYLQTITNEKTLVTGSRKFVSDVPFRSKFGNAITRRIFNLSTHLKLHDTQTGLRAFSSKLIPFMLSIEGTRYEYEMNVLLECSRNKIDIDEVMIKTEYTDNSPKSHFRIIKDSCIIYKDIIKFSLSSFTCFSIDYMLYSFILMMTGRFIMSNILARMVSSGLNFFINLNFVFDNKENIMRKAIQYFSLAASILFINSLLLNMIISTFGVDKYMAKVFVEMVMFFVNMTVQKLFIFKKKEHLAWDFEENYN